MQVVKQVIVVRKDLNMRKGKMIAQGAHASLAALLSTARYDEASGDEVLCIPMDSVIGQWLSGDFRKIAVSVNSEAELLAVHSQAEQNGLPCALIQDSGLTEFGGVKTYTACAIGPAVASDIDAITGSLSLL